MTKYKCVEPGRNLTIDEIYEGGPAEISGDVFIRVINDLGTEESFFSWRFVEQSQPRPHEHEQGPGIARLAPREPWPAPDNSLYWLDEDLLCADAD